MFFKRISSGVEGLNYILKGGFIPNRCYLVRGKSGTGKSTLGINFLLQGVKEKELDYDGLTRKIQVEKFRGSEFIEGKHTLKFSEKGIEVFPKISIMERKETFKKEFISSGVNEIDKMLAGGIEKGTITIISGPSGTGKTTLTFSFLKEIALSGRSALFFSFEEETDFLLARCEAINMNLRDKSLKDNLKLFKFAPKNNSIEEFYKILNDSLEKFKAEIVAIDSISSFENCFLSQDFKKDLYLICKNLQNSGITVFLVNEKESIAEDFSITSKGFSSMADNIIILNYIEIEGEIRKTIGVLKKRVSDFEKTIRQFEVTKDGIKVSKPLKNLKGILTGVPEKIKSRK